MLAAEVLPYFSIFLANFSAGISSLRQAASIIRALAWCGMTHAMSAGCKLHVTDDIRQIAGHVDGKLECLRRSRNI